MTDFADEIAYRTERLEQARADFIASFVPVDPYRDAVASGTHNGIDWAVRVGGYIGLCGYTRIPDDHPLNNLWGDPYDTCPWDDALDWDDNTITYAAQPWIGFDTNHTRDHWPIDTPYVAVDVPGVREFLAMTHHPNWGTVAGYRRYWTKDAVIAETHHLCDLIANYQQGEVSGG